MPDNRKTTAPGHNGHNGQDAVVSTGRGPMESEGFQGTVAPAERPRRMPEQVPTPEIQDADRPLANTPEMAREVTGTRLEGERELEVPSARDRQRARVAAYTEVDESTLLDAWYASYAPPSLRASVQRELLAGRRAPEVVIGPDDRVQVTATAIYPWRAICSLRITAANGSQWIGTGWLAGPRLVVTAGHCVFMRGQGGWVSNIEVIAGRNGSERPYGSRTAYSFRSVVGWVQNDDRNYDYGAIFLTGGTALGNEVGYFGFGTRSDAQLLSYWLNLSGYPGDKPVGTQWWHAQQTAQVTAQTITYMNDTYGGQSGAPVWVYMNGARTALGIHTNGSTDGNSATRINTAVFNNLLNWRNEAGS